MQKGDIIRDFKDRVKGKMAPQSQIRQENPGQGKRFLQQQAVKSFLKPISR
jgi:hypothetical protein